MKKILIVVLLAAFTLTGAYAKKQPQKGKTLSDREYWVELAYKMSAPVLENMSRGELKQNIQLELSPRWDNRDPNVTYLEMFGRLMAGIAPWLALPDDDTPEGAKRKQLREWALASCAHAVDPDSPDYLLWEGPHQVLVDASYLALAFIRAPKALWEPLDQVTKDRIIKEFKSLRKTAPWFNNWILFRGTIEAFFVTIGEDYDGYALNITVRKINEWYLGDGWYGDGPEFSLDYYNSYVIHPMYVEMIEVMTRNRISSPVSLKLAVARMQRYDRLIERLISPEATYPAVGRSVTYRMGAFQTLALSAWKYGLHKDLSNGQVRNALTSVMKRMFSAPSNFNEKGFLTLGFVGSQPGIADSYSNNGSMYLTSLVFLPLGLPADHDFWTAPAEKWTSQKAWGGEPFLRDYHESLQNVK